MEPRGSASIMEGALAGEGEGWEWVHSPHPLLYRGEVTNGGFGLVLDGTQVSGWGFGMRLVHSPSSHVPLPSLCFIPRMLPERLVRCCLGMS